jgi:peroxiredoxin
MKYLALALIAIFTITSIGNSTSTTKAVIGKAAPEFTLTDSEGKTHKLSDFKGKIVVLEWVNFDCPFVKKHYSVNNMQNLQKDYTSKGIVWLSICSSADGKQGNFKGQELKDRLKKENFAATAYLIDEDGKVGTSYGAKTTPNMFVIDAKGNLVYSGAIDDKASADSEDIKTSMNYVKSALDNVLAGKKVSTSTTKPYGCSVKYASK